MGYQVIAVSPDRPTKLQASIRESEFTYQLLSDSQMVTAKAFGLAYQLDAETVEGYREFGIDLEELSGQGHHQLPVPAVFLIGTDAVIDFQYVNPDYKVRLDPDLLLEAARVALEDDGV